MRPILSSLAELVVFMTQLATKLALWNRSGFRDIHFTYIYELALLLRTSVIMLDGYFQLGMVCRCVSDHYGDVIKGTMASQITSLTIVYLIVRSEAAQRKIKAPRYWPFYHICALVLVPQSLQLSRLNRSHLLPNGEFPAQMASNAENVSIWWRHHALTWLSLCGVWSQALTTCIMTKFQVLIVYVCCMVNNGPGWIDPSFLRPTQWQRQWS